MAIAADTFHSEFSTTNSSIQFSYTCTGTDVVLLAAVGLDSSSDILTDVQYNGVNLTLVSKTSNGSQYTYLYALTGAATGSAFTLIAHFSSTVFARMTAVSYNGAPDGILDNSSTSGAAGGDVSAALTTTADTAWHVAVLDARGAIASASTGATGRYSGSVSIVFADNNAAITPPGSNSFTMNVDRSANWVLINASVNNNTASKKGGLTLLGVG